jgi:hypothetical protein
MRTLNVHYIPTTKPSDCLFTKWILCQFHFKWIFKNKTACLNVRFNNTWMPLLEFEIVMLQGRFSVEFVLSWGRCTQECELEGVPEPQENARVQNLPLRKQLWFDFFNSFLFLENNKIFMGTWDHIKLGSFPSIMP